MACNTFVCTILYGLLESSKKNLLKDLVEKITEAKVAENDFYSPFSVNSIISKIKSLNKVFLNDSDRQNNIVQMNGLHVIYSVIEIFDVKVVYAIYSRVYASRHYGMSKIRTLLFKYGLHFI